MLSSVCLGSCGQGMGRQPVRSRGDQQHFIHLDGEMSCSFGAQGSMEHEKSPQSPGSACCSLPSAQEFLNHHFSEKWNQVRKHLDLPGNATKHLKVAVDQVRLSLLRISISTNGDNLSRQPTSVFNYP